MRTPPPPPAPSGPSQEHRLAQRIDTLRAAYAEQVPERLQQLQALFARWQAEESTEQTLPALIAQLHEFSGSALTFGFSILGEAARSLEQALRSGAGAPRSTAQHALLAQQMLTLSQLKAPEQGTLVALPTLHPSSSRAAGAELDPQRRRVQIVDDNLLLAEQLAEQLRYYGFVVETFGKLEKFAQAYRAAPPALVVMDIDFPEEEDNGPSVMGRLRHETGNDTPLIFISSHEGIHSRLMAVRAGGSRYLVKPVAITDLVDAVDALLSRASDTPYRVLLVDDSVTASRFYAAVLHSAGMEVRMVNAPLMVLDTLSEFQPDLALIDLYMPACSGQELAAVIRQCPAFVGLPIVYLSAETDRDKQLFAMQLGGDDFLTKPVNPDHLIASLRNRAARARQMAALIKTDSLTGLLNHISFKDAAALELARMQRADKPCTVVMIDLDNFKDINDRHGHPVGDRVLRSVARQLRQRLRNVDLIGRYGGEEFAVVLSGSDAPAALAVINRIREDFAHIAHSSNQGVFHATFSAGLASYPAFGDLTQLIDAADKGLYEAKRRGRNAAVVVKPPPLKAAG